MKKISTLFLVSYLFFSVKAQIPNAGFENWSNDGDGNWNPDSWQTSNSTPDTTVYRVAPGYAGNYAVRVTTTGAGSFHFPGTAYTDFAFTQRPDRFNFCYKATIMPGDKAIVFFSASSGDSSIAAPDSCTFKILASVTTYQCVSLPLRYISALTPDSANITILAGDFLNSQTGTSVTVDQLSFSYGTGINETEVPLSAVVGQSYPNPSAGTLYIPFNLSTNAELTLDVFDVAGRKVKNFANQWIPRGEHTAEFSVANWITEFIRI